MPTLVTSLVGRLRKFVGDRRRSPRRKARVYARLPFTVIPLETKEQAADDIMGKRSLAGSTSDLSETGLTLLLNSVRIGSNYLTDLDHYIGIKLELPDGSVSMLAAPARFRDMSEAESEFRYLLGVRIIRMQEDARARYRTYLRTLKTKERRARQPASRADEATAASPAQTVGQADAWANLTPACVSEAFEAFLRESAHP